MNSEWTSTTLGEFCLFSYGKALPERNRITGTVPVISSAGIVGYHNQALVKTGGIVIGRKGTVGSVILSKKPFWAIDTAFFIVDEPQKRDLRFTYYLLKTLNLHQMNSDSAVPGLNRGNAHALSVNIPPPHLQRKISSILGALDDHILLLRNTNLTLEAIAQALFKSWFVDFDPVRAKAEGREPEGIDPETAALFPDCFEETELGLVPKGWKVGFVGDFACQKKGSINPLNSPNITFEHYSLPAFDNGKVPVYEKGAVIKSNKTTLPLETVLLSKLNPFIPRVWLPVKYGDNAVCSTEFLAFSPTQKSSKEFIYTFFCSPPFYQRLCQMVTGTSNSRILSAKLRLTHYFLV